MEKLVRSHFVQSALAVFLLLLTQVILAQDNSSTSTSTHTTTTTTQTWYVSPLVWVAAGAVFLIIIFALITRSGRRDKLVIKKSE